ncbi:MAG: hypothetical protein ACRDTA_26495 [Pseudonocardiaceae bacterium]
MNRRAVPGVSAVAVPESERGHRAAHDDSVALGYYVGGCGHPTPIGPDCRVGECRICDPERPAVPSLRLPASELYSIDVTASVADTVSWWCRLCDHEATVTSVPAADTAAVEHLAEVVQI